MTTHKVYVIKGDNGYQSYGVGMPEGEYYANVVPSSAEMYTTPENAYGSNVNCVVNPKIKVWEIQEKDLDTQD